MCFFFYNFINVLLNIHKFGVIYLIILCCFLVVKMLVSVVYFVIFSEIQAEIVLSVKAFIFFGLIKFFMENTFSQAYEKIETIKI